MANILVTGANGFIGKQLVPYLKIKGHYVRCAVWQLIPEFSHDQVIVNRLDSTINWEKALEGIDCVIHLAARVHIIDPNKSSYDEFIKINSEATKQLASQAAQHGVKRFIFLSSIKVNGEFTTNNKPFTEQDVPLPEDMYAKSKLLAENYLNEISKSTDLKTISLRPPLVYGPGVKANFLKLIQRIEQGWPLPFANINNKRSFIYIDNLIHAIEILISAPLEAQSCFLLCDDEAWSLPDLIKQIALNLNPKQKPRLFAIPLPLLKLALTAIGKKSTVERLTNSLLVDNNCLKSCTDWKPITSSVEGITRTIQWYLQEGEF